MKLKLFTYTLLLLVVKISFGQNDLKDSNGIKSVENDKVYTITEQMPEYPGGMAEMIKFIGKNIRYPKKEKRKGIEGTCYISFIVDKTGEIRDVTIIKGIKNGKLCDAEASRVVKKMPKWIPGKQNGKNVDVQFNLPIKFTIR